MQHQPATSMATQAGHHPRGRREDIATLDGELEAELILAGDDDNDFLIGSEWYISFEIAGLSTSRTRQETDQE